MDAMSESVTSSEEQEANAFLRERFLHHLITLTRNKKFCKIAMYEQTEVSGYIKAVDLNSENIIVENLTTPQKTSLESAVLRTSDILTISYQ